MATTFNGQLSANIIYNATYNAYELVTTIADQLLGLSKSVAEQFREDCSPYITDKVYTDFDILKSHVFDPDDTNVLKPGQKVVPKQEFIRIDSSRQIDLYTPTEFLTKTAWMSEGSWAQFNSTVQKNLRATKEAYDYLMGMVAIGTMEATAGKQQLEITIPKAAAGATAVEKEAVNRLAGQTIGMQLEILKSKLKDLTSDYNDYGFRKSFRPEDFVYVYNIEQVVKVNKMDLPGIYHKDGVADLKGDMVEARYFGIPGKVTGTAITSDGSTQFAMEEQDVTDKDNNVYHVYPGDVIPANVSLASTTAILVPFYTKDPTILGKFIHKQAIKYLTGYETESEFWNAKNLSTNRYLTWYFARPQRLSSYPIVTIRLKEEA